VALNDHCRALHERGITRVVSVVSAEKRTLPKAIVSHHLHIQAHDSLNACLLTHFPRICAFVEDAREANASVFVHCGAGISRAPKTERRRAKSEAQLSTYQHANNTFCFLNNMNTPSTIFSNIKTKLNRYSTTIK
jgi:predicted protein tyrosine phosphatase